MSYLVRVWDMFRAVVKTLRLALPKLGIGWMFALLTIDFNRIAIVELGITAFLISTMLGLHYFLSPFQVIVGRIADRHPIAGLRRTPYIILGGILASCIFMALPSVVHAMSAGVPFATPAGFLLLLFFGIAVAMIGDGHHALIAEVVPQKSRGGVISVVWTFTILSTILAAVVMNIVRPEYTPEAMQRLYNLTPWIVVGSALLGLLGMERRLTGDELAASIETAKRATPPGNPLAVAIGLLRDNPQTRGFFAFIFVAMLSIFLQDNILEVFGAEVFALSVEETTRFQPTWGGGVLLGMILMGLLSVLLPISKRRIAIIGSIGTALGMTVLAFAAHQHQFALVSPALFGMGLFTGFFNVGALSMMMDMTIEGATGLYMGLWGVAQAFGTGIASISSGILHTGLIESGVLSPGIAYGFIFAAEGIGMLVATIILLSLSVDRFHSLHEQNLHRRDMVRVMEAGAAA